MKRSILGFTYIELVVAAFVIGILGSIAYPAFLDYSRRAYYTEIVAATEPLKLAVAECYKIHKTFMGCNAGSFKIPANVIIAKGHVASTTVVNGVIVVTPVPGKSFVTTDTYTLTPTLKGKDLLWASSGNAVKSGYVQ